MVIPSLATIDRVLFFQLYFATKKKFFVNVFLWNIS